MRLSKSMRGALVLLCALLTATPALAAELDPTASTLLGWSEIGLPPVFDTRFGTAVATGDFDCDGHEDVAVGIPFLDGPAPQTGAVYVEYANDGGAQWLSRTDAVLPDAFYGTSLAAGDLNDDGCVDLVVGEPGYAARRGRAHVHRGDAAGLLSAEYELSTSAPVAELGRTVAIVTGDGIPPFVAAGAPEVPNGPTAEVGRVFFVLDPLGQPTLMSRQCRPSPAADDRCGDTLATGTLDGTPTLFAGAPGANMITSFRFGSGGGIERTTFAAPESEGYSRFGSVFEVLDVDGVAEPEIVVGQPEATVNGRSSAGRLALLRFAPGPEGMALETVWNRHQAQFGFSAEAGDRFGSMVRRFDLDGDAVEDLVVGAQGEAFGTDPGAGSILVLRASGGFELTTMQILRPADLGLIEESELQFGGFRASVASLANPNAAGRDLLVGVPLAIRDPELGLEGAVVRVPQRLDVLFADSFESGDPSAWSHVEP